MKRADLYTAIVAATQITRTDSVIIIGSQSILGTFSDRDLPFEATMSAEIDIVPLADDDDQMIATLLDAKLGEWSQFHDEQDFYVQGVGRETAQLPAGWEDRLVPVAPPDHPGIVGLCLDPHDLCAAKLVANRENDLIFVHALIGAGLSKPSLLRNRVEEIPDAIVDPVRKRIARAWVKHEASLQNRRA